MKAESSRIRKRFGVPFEDQLQKVASGCWEWAGKVDKDGYGVRGSRYGEKRAHRFAYTREFGDIPDGLVVRHKCDNVLCCNPQHLELGSHADNITDKVSRGRQATGSKIRTTILDVDRVREIRRLYAEGIRQVDLASRFGIDQTTTSQIVRRKTWKYA